MASTDMQAVGLPAPPKRICILVEPSPFTYVCGYMNRYRNTIRYLKELGCEVLIVTPGKVRPGGRGDFQDVWHVPHCA